MTIDRRTWLALAGAGTSALATNSQAQSLASSSARGATWLTVSGAIRNSNRGPVHPQLEQLFIKHKVGFERAMAFDEALIRRLPARSIKPLLEYDSQAHELQGPLLSQVLETAGVSLQPKTALVLRALDGYTVVLTGQQVMNSQMILAHTLDRAPIGLGGLGPLWAVWDPARQPELMSKPLNERYALCPWGLYHVEVKAG